MNIVRVKFEKMFPAGAYLNERIGFEIDLDKYETQKEQEDMTMYAIDYLRNLAEQNHKEKYPQFYQEETVKTFGSGDVVMSGDFNISDALIEQSDKDKALIATIKMCTSIKFLENFGKRANESLNVEVRKAWDEQYEKLKSEELSK